jgi:hypothetical protein
MSFSVTCKQEEGYMLATLVGTPSIDEFLGILQQLGGESVKWAATAVLVDLRGVITPYSFTEQLRIGVSVGTNLAHLRKSAAVVPPERITRVGEKAANYTGATVRVFALEEEAVAWLLS